MKSAQVASLQDARRFGIELNASDITTSDITMENLFEDEEEELGLEAELELENLQEKEAVEKYVEVVGPDGTIKKVRKSTFVWMLSESKEELSSGEISKQLRWESK